MKPRLIAGWRREAGRLWTMRIAIGGAAFWAALSGLWALWPAFVEKLPLWFYAIGGILMSVVLGVARLMKQPGADE